MHSNIRFQGFVLSDKTCGFCGVCYIQSQFKPIEVSQGLWIVPKWNCPPVCTSSLYVSLLFHVYSSCQSCSCTRVMLQGLLEPSCICLDENRACVTNLRATLVLLGSDIMPTLWDNLICNALVLFDQQNFKPRQVEMPKFSAWQGVY